MKKVTSIRPYEVMEDGNRSVQYKGRDGKMHDIANDSNGSGAQSSAIENYPDAYEIVATGEYVNGTATYKAVTCDENKTEIPVRDFADILLQNPNTIVITRISPLDNQIEVIRVDLIKEDKSQITLLGNRVMVHVFLDDNGNDIILSNPNYQNDEEQFYTEPNR